MEVMMNREQRRAARRAKPPRRGAGHIQMPITMRFSAQDETQMMLIPHPIGRQVSRRHCRRI